ncbi:MAG: cobalamin-dependent protein [Candidatus Omnitrophica bacterium]|nr:cobalamin-dependent protein [Candidatus Omnitrophota bacterium]
MRSNDEFRKLLIEQILAGERERANALIDEAAASGSYRQAMQEILEPVLIEIGNQWADENISLAQGYVAGKVAEDLLLKISATEQTGLGQPPEKGPVVLGNIEDDYHSLGRRLVSIFLQSAGWKVIDMGSDVLAKEFVDKAVETGARVIGASAMMYTTAGNIRKIREELDRRGLSARIKLAVGGAVFRLRSELADEVGADGTAANGFQVPVLFEALWERSLREAPG